VSDGTPIPPPRDRDQLTVWDAWVDEELERAGTSGRWIAGMIDSLSNLSDDVLVAVGRLARREAAAAGKRPGARSEIAWLTLLEAATTCWLARHPRP
jgi:hypothetical protein